MEGWRVTRLHHVHTLFGTRLWRVEGWGSPDFIMCMRNTSMESGGVEVHQTSPIVHAHALFVSYLSGLNPLPIVSIPAFHIIWFLLYSLYLYIFAVFVIFVVLIA